MMYALPDRFCVISTSPQTHWEQVNPSRGLGECTHTSAPLQLLRGFTFGPGSPETRHLWLRVKNSSAG
ncbi:hypothetical protein AAFF_G00085720 [Aldrovandia affinis]|uniref:Uncharacterized protein n=1 Tax=Aldrovandia affinis TaxID=143900 RepID=A0AAD7WCS2_9TELE|nr:hypothetical protein AAFF_G00085720 [Aldrovandia affinis]